MLTEDAEFWRMGKRKMMEEKGEDIT